MNRLEEVELLELIAEGLTAKEMSERLGISVRSVNYRLQLLYAIYRIPNGTRRNIRLLNAVGMIGPSKA